MQHLHYDGSPILIVQYTTLGYDPESNGLQLLLIAADIMMRPTLCLVKLTSAYPRSIFSLFRNFFGLSKGENTFFHKSS